MPDYLLSARRVRRGEFIAEPGKTRFLKSPSNRRPVVSHSIPRADWLRDVFAEGQNGQDPESGEDCGDIAVFVHGFNTSPIEVAKRHRQLKKSLASNGYQGALVSFDWPSNDLAINYLEDRVDAKLTALNLVRDGISLLAATQEQGCKYNVHVIAHSAGGYVVREAFDDADDRPAIAARNWNVSQLCLIGADVSSRSLSPGDVRSSSLYRHCTRVTNYFNPYDSALKLSNVKRAGVAPRAGRRGMPADRPEKAYDIDCGTRFRASNSPGNGHSWYFDDAAFVTDLAETLGGETAGDVIAARRKDSQGNLHLE